MVKSTVIPEPFINFNGRLAEGVTYNPSNNTLVWVDIRAGTINRTSLSTKTNPTSFESYKIDESVGVIGLTKNPDVYLCGVSNGIGQFNFATKKFKTVIKYPAKYHSKAEYGTQLRSNDGSIAPNGVFYVGTMADFSEPVGPIGKMYEYKPGSTELKVVIDGCSIPNGLNWFDGYLYYTNSSEHKIYKVKCKESTYEPDLTVPMTTYVDMADVFADYDNLHAGETIEGLQAGEPDGSCMDSEGNLYIAVWGTNRVIKIGYKSGKFEEEWMMPAKRVSCVTIGGVDMDELFITTADLNLDEVDKLGSVQSDLGGNIFKVKLTSNKGLPKNTWGGKLVV